MRAVPWTDITQKIMENSLTAFLTVKILAVLLIASKIKLVQVVPLTASKSKSDTPVTPGLHFPTPLMAELAIPTRARIVTTLAYITGTW